MLFTIIIPHYDKSVSDEDFEKCLMSLYTQEFKDFEVLIYHDGELSKPLSRTSLILLDKINAKFSIRPYKGVWGHNNRDLGIKEATGDHIIHLNADNVLYDLTPVAKAVQEQEKIYIFPIKMYGMIIVGDKLVRTRNIKDAIVLTGIPKLNNIDCMQLIAPRKYWIDFGGWYDLSEDSDGKLYEKMCSMWDYTIKADIILGEHY